MKIAIIVTRVFMGLLFLFSSVVYLFKLIPVPELHGDVKIFNEGLAVAIYFMPLLKCVELICSLSLLSGRYVALSSVVLFPIVLNIFLFHAFLAPEGLVIAILLLLGNLFLAYVYREKYKPLFQSK
jgi:putative oxidoreductase